MLDKVETTVDVGFSLIHLLITAAWAVVMTTLVVLFVGLKSHVPSLIQAMEIVIGGAVIGLLQKIRYSSSTRMDFYICLGVSVLAAILVLIFGAQQVVHSIL